MPFPQAPAGARWILGWWRRLGWLWCSGRSCWWWSWRMTKRSSPAGSSGGRRGGLTDLISLRFFVFSVKIWLVWRRLDLHFKSSFTHAFTVVCETPKSLAICRIGRWGVSSMIIWTFSMNSLVRVFLAMSFRSTTSKRSSDALSCVLKR